MASHSGIHGREIYLAPSHLSMGRSTSSLSVDTVAQLFIRAIGLNVNAPRGG